MLLAILQIWMSVLQPALVAFLARHHHFAYIPRFKLLPADSGDRNLSILNDTQTLNHNMVNNIYSSVINTHPNFVPAFTSDATSKKDHEDTIFAQLPMDYEISGAHVLSTMGNFEAHESDGMKTVDLSASNIRILGKRLSEYLTAETIDLGADLKTSYALAALQVIKQAETSNDAITSIFLLIEEYFDTISLEDDLQKSEHMIILAGHFMGFHRDLESVAELMIRTAVESMTSSIRFSSYNPRSIPALCVDFPLHSAAIFLFLYSISRPFRLLCYYCRKVLTKLCMCIVRLPFVIVFTVLVAQDFEKFNEFRVLLSAHCYTEEFRKKIREEILLDAGIVPYYVQKKQEEERARAGSMSNLTTTNEDHTDSEDSCPDHIPELDFSEMSDMSMDPDTMRPKKRYEIDIDDFLRKIHDRRWKKLEDMAREELRKRKERKAKRQAEKARVIGTNSDIEAERRIHNSPAPMSPEIDDTSQVEVDLQTISFNGLSEEFTSMEFAGTSTPVQRSPRKLKTTGHDSSSSCSKISQSSCHPSNSKDVENNNEQQVPPVPAILVTNADSTDTPKLSNVPEYSGTTHHSTVEGINSDMELSLRGLLDHRDIRFRVNDISGLDEPLKSGADPSERREESNVGSDKGDSESHVVHHSSSQGSQPMDTECDELYHWKVTVLAPQSGRAAKSPPDACEGDNAKVLAGSESSTIPGSRTGGLNEIRDLSAPANDTKLSKSLSSRQSTSSSAGSPLSSSGQPSSTLKGSPGLQPDTSRETQEVVTAYRICSCLKEKIPSHQQTLVERLLNVFLENCDKPQCTEPKGDEQDSGRVTTPGDSVEKLPQISPSAGKGRHVLASVTERLKRADRGLNLFMRRVNRKNAFQTLKKNIRNIDKALKKDSETSKSTPVQVTEVQERQESNCPVNVLVESVHQALPTDTQEQALSEENHSAPLASVESAQPDNETGERLIVISDVRHVAGYCMPRPLDSMTNSKGRNDDLIVKLRLGDRVEELHTTDRILETIVPVDEIERKREDFREYISGTLMWQQSIVYNCELGLEADYSEVYDVGEKLLVRTWLLTWESEEDVTNNVLPTWSVEHMGELPSPFRRRRKTGTKEKKPATSSQTALPAAST